MLRNAHLTRPCRARPRTSFSLVPCAVFWPFSAYDRPADASGDHEAGHLPARLSRQFRISSAASTAAYSTVVCLRMDARMNQLMSVTSSRLCLQSFLPFHQNLAHQVMDFGIGRSAQSAPLAGLNRNRPEGLNDQSESVVAMLRNAHLNGLAALVRGQVFCSFLSCHGFQVESIRAILRWFADGHAAWLRVSAAII